LTAGVQLYKALGGWQNAAENSPPTDGKTEGSGYDMPAPSEQ
jgi:hypothetical protein